MLGSLLMHELILVVSTARQILSNKLYKSRKKILEIGICIFFDCCCQSFVYGKKPCFFYIKFSEMPVMFYFPRILSPTLVITLLGK